jgi:hypothetical protein
MGSICEAAIVAYAATLVAAANILHPDDLARYSSMLVDAGLVILPKN